MKNQPKPLADLGTILSIASAYALFVSAIYLYCYWGSFGLDPFQYLGLGDLIPHAMLPFLPLLLLALFINVMMFVLRPAPAHFMAGSWHVSIFKVILTAIILGLTVQAYRSEGAGRIVIVMAIVLFLAWISTTDYERIGLLALFIIFVLAYGSYTGVVAASKAKQGKGVLFVESASGLATNSCHPLSYLGQLGASFVFYEVGSEGAGKIGRLMIVRTDKVERLTLGPEPVKQPGC